MSMARAFRKLEALTRENFQANASTAAFLTAQEDTLETWDKELNRIYAILMNKLPESEFNVLREYQREWLQEKERLMGAALADEHPEWESYTKNLHANLIQYTVERTLELIDLCFGND